MKLQSFILPALAGISTANAEEKFQNAEAYIIRQSKTTTTSNPPSIPNELARAILLQRLSTSEQPSSLGQLPESISQDESILYINQYAKAPRPLFEEFEDANEPRQLLIAFSGVTDGKYKDLKAALSNVPLTFTAPGLSQLPVGGKKTGCVFEKSINTENEKCWNGKTQYLQYNVAKNKDIIAQLGRNIESLTTQALDGKLETTILLLAHPSTESEELRRRDLETELVIAEIPEATDIPTADSSYNADGTKNHANDDKPFHAFSSKPSGAASRPPALLPSCFTSHNACITATDSCSGHGSCINKWAKLDIKDSCFFCHCLTTNETDAKGRTGVFRWGGSSCHKRDVSTPFWLFAGVSIALVSTVAFSISLLFSVGEEKLPGVIGAGVSRSK
ncbi:hypothetical protein F4804DRAFT_124759 [Jackrogersella minutella]|nr:hypothetical protein F4804DRAFT_124759 [Jackrogersella minutella]